MCVCMDCVCQGRVLLQEEFSMDVIDILDRAAQGKRIKNDTEI